MDQQRYPKYIDEKFVSTINELNEKTHKPEDDGGIHMRAASEDAVGVPPAGPVGSGSRFGMPSSESRHGQVLGLHSLPRRI